MNKLTFSLLTIVLLNASSLSFPTNAASYGGKYDHPVVDVGESGVSVAGGKYKTGDVIEVLFNKYKGWETAVVMPYLGSDISAGRERWLRAWIPSLPNEVVGVEVMMENVRPGSLAKLERPEEPYSGKVSSIVDAVLSTKFGSGNGASASTGQNGAAQPRGATSNGASASNAASLSMTGTTSNTTSAKLSNTNGGPIPGGVSAKPAMNGSLPNLAGTAWKQLYEKNVTVVPVFLFCKSGHWEVVRYTLAAGMMGSWKASGNTLTLTNSTDGKSENYSMTYNASQNLLLLNDGRVTLRLLYNGSTQCK